MVIYTISKIEEKESAKKKFDLIKYELEDSEIEAIKILQVSDTDSSKQVTITYRPRS